MLRELIDKFYLSREKDREQHHFYITDAGKCPRSLFFKFKKAPREAMEAKILRMFDHGDYIHQLIMKPLFGMREINIAVYYWFFGFFEYMSALYDFLKRVLPNFFKKLFIFFLSPNYFINI